MIDSLRRKVSEIEIDTAQPHVAVLAASPPTRRVANTGFIERPHTSVKWHGYIIGNSIE